MNESINCPVCGSNYAYFDGIQYVCPECAHEWSTIEEDATLLVKDANGTILQDGDSVIIIKDLKVKGSSQPLK